MSLKGYAYGRLTKDPEVKQSQNGNTNYTQFSIAVDNGKNSDGSDKSIFINISAFGKQGELIAQSCKKGHRIVVHFNSIEANAWTNQQSGQAQAGLNATLGSFEFVETKAEAGQQPQNNPQQQPNYNQAPPPQPQYGQAPPPQYGQPPQNYGQPQPNYNQAPPNYNQPPQPQPQYNQAPPPTNQPPQQNYAASPWG